MILNVTFLTQPNNRLGDIIHDCFEQFGIPQELRIVSAFASLPTILRFKPLFASVQARGGTTSLVLGVDLGGTSREVLSEVAGWTTPVTIFKNALGGVTFHPKLYLLRWAGRAEIFVGSHNLTEGGHYRNYEASVQTTYDLPNDQNAFQIAFTQLRPFLIPVGVTAAELTTEYLARLLSLPQIPYEGAARATRGEAKNPASIEKQTVFPFGYEPIPSAPRLPPELLKLLLQSRADSQAKNRRAARAAVHAARNAGVENGAAAQPLNEIDANAFYMTLATSRGTANPNIPGEQRIPLAAIEISAPFWGWPEEYRRVEKGPDPQNPRVYREWKPIWRIRTTTNLDTVTDQAVRMYFYENSSDFRFYAGRLVALGAAAGDVIEIRRSKDADIAFECTLAKPGSEEHRLWSTYTTETVRNSNRLFGFA